MRFGIDVLHFPGVLVLLGGGVLVASLVFLFIWNSLQYARAERRWGDPSLLSNLVTSRSPARRAWKAAIYLLAVTLMLLALLRPQFGTGTRYIPATNVDVVIVLDYSKSMFAQDFKPNRSARAKAEVGRLIQALPGVRFGAVAFAGDPFTFPLSSDGSAIAQFFRGITPNDMPVGGTAIARALDRGKDLFLRDPKSKDHYKIMVLITDGEDLEGDPVKVAKAGGIRVDVVQIGGRSAEVVPDVARDGRILGVRRDETGKPLMTSLSQEGEAQLAEIATSTGGVIVRSEQGETGIDRITSGIKQVMREELSAREETIFEEQYKWFLGAALLLLFVDSILAESSPARSLGARMRGWLAGKRKKESEGT